MINLKMILLLLGNGMVEGGYSPAEGIMLRRLRAVHRGHDVGDPWEEDRRNAPYREKDMGHNRMAGIELIVLLTEWLNANTDAQEVLAEQGVEWPVAGEPPVPKEHYTFRWNDHEEHWGTLCEGMDYDPDELSAIQYLEMLDSRGNTVRSLHEIAFGLDLEKAEQDRRDFEAQFLLEGPDRSLPEPVEQTEIERLRDEVRHWKGHADQYKADLDEITGNTP